MELTFTLYHELHKDCRHIREVVFVQEQGFVYEFDDTDSIADHVVMYADGEPAATGRIFCQDGTWYIGRIAVMPQYRGKGFGSRVMRYLEEEVSLRGAKSATLAAQCRAAGFYEKNGYSQTNDFHDEEGVPHVMMTKRL